MSIKLEWEEIDDYHKRAKIQGGWLVKTYEDRFVSFHEEQRPEPGYEWQVSMCFVPDINHEWGNPVSGSDATIHIAENDMHLFLPILI